jgi:hypothetical protein
MGNMSYCKFQNTLEDLRACYDEMDDAESATEQRCRKKLVNLCKQIWDDYGGTYGDGEDDD